MRQAAEGDGQENAPIPVVKRIEHDPQAHTITITAVQGEKPFNGEDCRWIAEGKEIHRGLSLNYRTTPGIRHYVRAELRGRGGLVCTNPFGFSLPAESSSR